MLLERRCLLLFVHFAIASTAPSCRYTNEGRQLSYACTGFTDADDFDRVFVRPQPHLNLTLYLGHGHVSHLSSGAFRGLHLKKLIFENFTVDNFMPSSESNPFTDVKDNLETIYFRRGSSTPSSWSALKDLEVLRALMLVDLENVSITNDMSEIPQSIKFLEFYLSSISRIDDGALYRLNNIKLFTINNCELPDFSWSVLPNPSPALELINLGANNLTKIPSGFVPEQFPSLRFLDLYGNRITSVEEADLNPFRLHNRTSISLTHNPIHCDCRVQPLREFDPDSLSGNCETPESLKGRKIQSLTDAEVACTSAA